MWLKSALIFVAGVVVGGLGASYIAGVEQGRRETLADAHNSNCDDADDLGTASEFKDFKKFDVTTTETA